jgi:hypothetical protein
VLSGMLEYAAKVCQKKCLLNVITRLVSYQHALVNWIQRTLVWLDSWPAGLKLNTELSRFYSHSFVDLVAIWGRMCLLFSCHPLALMQTEYRGTSRRVSTYINCHLPYRYYEPWWPNICYCPSARCFEDFHCSYLCLPYDFEGCIPEFS